MGQGLRKQVPQCHQCPLRCGWGEHAEIWTCFSSYEQLHKSFDSSFVAAFSLSTSPDDCQPTEEREPASYKSRTVSWNKLKRQGEGGTPQICCCKTRITQWDIWDSVIVPTGRITSYVAYKYRYLQQPGTIKGIAWNKDTNTLLLKIFMWI